jgi:hypothetical protein
MSLDTPDRMLVLDFSGTLSLEAALYAREENLVRALQESGLWKIGVDSPAAFWDQMVTPTWQEGSTTDQGYTSLLSRQMHRMAASRGREFPEGVVWLSASHFVQDYLHRSVIDPTWQGIIHRLLRHPGLLVVVATDHYAEATEHILSHLRSLDIEAAPLLKAGSQRVLVANSADLGCHKASQGFWTNLQEARGIETLSRIVLVDDFGFHEQPQDDYAQRAKIAERREETVRTLSTLFAAPTYVFSFLLRELIVPPLEKEQVIRTYRALIQQAGRFAAEVLGIQAFGD